MNRPLITVGGGAGAPLDRSGSAVLDANGRGEVMLGPVPSGQLWSITRMTVFCTGTNNPMPVCSVYDGPERPGNLIDATYTGGQDVSDCPSPLELPEQEALLFVWTGGVPGSTATGRLVGTQLPA